MCNSTARLYRSSPPKVCCLNDLQIANLQMQLAWLWWWYARRTVAIGSTSHIYRYRQHLHLKLKKQNTHTHIPVKGLRSGEAPNSPSWQSVSTDLQQLLIQESCVQKTNCGKTQCLLLPTMPWQWNRWCWKGSKDLQGPTWRPKHIDRRVTSRY